MQARYTGVMTQPEHYIPAIQKALSPDLRTPKWAAKASAEDAANPMKGHCYVAAEVLFHLLGGKDAGWKPMTLNHDTFPEGLPEQGDTHWYLQHADGRIADPTASQFGAHEVPYDKGKGCGFLTREPSRRARVVMERMAAPQQAAGFSL